MKILVLAKEVPDTWSPRTLDPVTGWLDRAATESVLDEINERALEHALIYRESGAEVEIVVLTVGPMTAESSVRKLLAMGADSAVIVSDENIAGSDTLRTSRILASAISKIGPDLVLAGTESTDGSCGVVPSMLAEFLGWSILPSLATLQIQDNQASGELWVDGEIIHLLSAYPVIASVIEKSAEPRFPSFKGTKLAKKKPVEFWSLSDIGVDPLPAASTMISAAKRPPRPAGVKSTEVDAAVAELVEYLATKQLI
jgi:electron transfer flavoprotein beta subunit